MALGDLYLISKAAFQSALLLGSLFIIVPMATGLADFAGRCPFWLNAHWNTSQPHSLNVTEWGLQSNCNFGVFIGCAQLLVSAIYVVYVGAHLHLQRDASFLTVFFGVQISLFFTISLLMEAVIISGGILHWCLLMSGASLDCEQAQFYNVLRNYPEIYTQRFLFTFGFARIGLWFSALVWFADLTLMLCHLVKLHRQERFLVSLRREAALARNRLYGDPSYANI